MNHVLSAIGTRYDLTGRRFGRLVILSEAEPAYSGDSFRRRWLCRCDCGKEKIIMAQCLKAKGFSTVSCGCHKRRLASLLEHAHPVHGHSSKGKRSPTYRSWTAMKFRCLNPGHVAYPAYGGRGVKVCERWMSFENFLADMGERPEGTTLDRKDPNGNYEFGNCQWATPKQQGRNRRNNRLVMCCHQTLTIAEWSEITGLKKTTIRERLKRGRSTADALFAPTTKGGDAHEQIAMGSR